MESTIKIHGIEIRLDSREVVIGAEIRHLPWRAFDVLVALARRPGVVVPKSELLSEVWGEVLVDESNLTQAISQIRRVLPPLEPGKQRIETIPRIGYRWVSPELNPMQVVPRSAGMRGRGTLDTGGQSRVRWWWLRWLPSPQFDFKIPRNDGMSAEHR